MGYAFEYYALIGALAFALFGLPFLNRDNPLARAVVISFTLVLATRYLLWRLFVTILPYSAYDFRGFWLWACFIVEILAFAESLVFFIIMFRHTDRRKEADLYEKRLRALAPEELPTVDVFIPTYNENLEVLERSILGCLHLDWPRDKLKVWVLDDGKRDWLRDYCVEKGAGYIRRDDNIHAKAGNLNYGSKYTKGEFIAVFDADFIPFRHFLYRTIGFFFADPKIGILQTPQAFFNKDFYQSNLHLHDSVPDEQRIFFDVMMPARDAWDSAFWCGSCSVTRRKAIEKVGGVPTLSITEDLTTTLAMLRHNYVTRYLNEKLSHGLAPESLEGLKAQRERWSRGTIQAMYSKQGPFAPGLTLVQRLLFLPIHWVFSPIGRLMSFIIPLVYLYFGIPALVLHHFTQPFDFHFPFIIMNYFVMLWLAPRHYTPFLSTAVLSLNTIEIIPETLKALIWPWGRKEKRAFFSVTPKGAQNRKKGVHWFSLSLSLTFFVLTAIAIVVNTFTELTFSGDRGFFPIAAAWATVNIILSGIMVLLSFEHPRWRVDERFKVNAPHTFYEGDRAIVAYVLNISTGGFSFVKPQEWDVTSNQNYTLWVPDVGKLPFHVIGQSNQILHCQFVNLTPQLRDRLIQHIFTGKYDNATALVAHRYWVRDLLRRAFGYHDHIYRPQKNKK
jgi:cellulose synthase (UDP-forming)